MRRLREAIKWGHTRKRMPYSEMERRCGVDDQTIINFAEGETDNPRDSTLGPLWALAEEEGWFREALEPRGVEPVENVEPLSREAQDALGSWMEWLGYLGRRGLLARVVWRKPDERDDEGPPEAPGESTRLRGQRGDRVVGEEG